MQDTQHQTDVRDARIEQWLAAERRRVNRGYGGFDDWREEDVDRETPLKDVSVGEILEKALGIEPARWSRADQMRVTAYLKATGWQRYQARTGERSANRREWRYRC